MKGYAVAKRPFPGARGKRPSRAYFHGKRIAAAPETGAAAHHAMQAFRSGRVQAPGSGPARAQAGLPAGASTVARAFTLGVLALLRMSVFTYFVE